MGESVLRSLVAFLVAFIVLSSPCRVVEVTAGELDDESVPSFLRNIVDYADAMLRFFIRAFFVLTTIRSWSPRATGLCGSFCALRTKQYRPTHARAVCSALWIVRALERETHLGLTRSTYVRSPHCYSFGALGRVGEELRLRRLEAISRGVARGNQSERRSSFGRSKIRTRKIRTRKIYAGSCFKISVRGEDLAISAGAKSTETKV